MGRICPCCGGSLHKIGETVKEMFDVVPVQYRVKRMVRPRYGCRGCESAVVQAPAPAQPIDGGMATEAVLAHVATMKYGYQVPLYRQEQMLTSQGIDLDRATLALWMGRLAWWLKPLHEVLLDTVLSYPKLFADETPLPVLDPGRGKTKTGRLWVAAMDDRPWGGPAPPAVVYVFAEDRKGERATDLFAGFNGILQVDGYAGYNGLLDPARPGGPVTFAFCFAHSRRKFYDVHVATGSPIAAEAVRRIGEFYAIEDRIRGKSADIRCAVRQAETKPLMEDFKLWLEARLGEVSQKSGLAEAISKASAMLASGKVWVMRPATSRMPALTSRIPARMPRMIVSMSRKWAFTMWNAIQFQRPSGISRVPPWWYATTQTLPLILVTSPAARSPALTPVIS